MPKRIVPIGRKDPKFRYLDRPALQQPAGAPSVIWSSCVTGTPGKGTGGAGMKMQTAFAYTERGAELSNRAQGLIVAGAALITTGVAAPVGIAFAAFGFIQAVYAKTTGYVQFSRPCSEDKNRGMY